MFSTLHQAARQVGEVIIGKHLQICQALARLLARRGHSRAPHQGPHGYAARLAASPGLPRTHDAMARFLAIYAAMKYGNASPDEHTRARRTLRRPLTLCR